MLDFVKVLNSTKATPKKDLNTQENLSSCYSNIHDANHNESNLSRVPYSSRPISRKNSISSIQSQPNPITTNQTGASSQKMQDIVVDQEKLHLKNQIARLKDENNKTQSRLEKLEKKQFVLERFCSCLIPFLGLQWTDMKDYTQNPKKTPNENNLVKRHNELQDDINKLKTGLENLVNVSKTTTGYNISSAPKRFVHQETPMNPNKGLPHNKGEPMDEEPGCKQYQF